MYTIELNIEDLKDGLVKIMAGVAANNGFEVISHGKDRLVFTSDSGVNYTNMINELSRVCKVYGIEYLDLLV